VKIESLSISPVLSAKVTKCKKNNFLFLASKFPLKTLYLTSTSCTTLTIKSFGYFCLNMFYIELYIAAELPFDGLLKTPGKSRQKARFPAHC